MSEKYAPKRRWLLALEAETAAPSGMIVQPPRGLAVPADRQTALSIPESVRALGEPLEPFFEACGGRQSISLSVRRSGSASTPETFVFHQPFVLVGRCRESDLPLTDQRVNFRHLYLQLIAGHWMFLDLAMIAGGPPDHPPRNPWGWLSCQHELPVGPYTITRVGSPPRDMSRPPQPVDAALPVVDLEFLGQQEDSDHEPSWRIDGAVSLVGASRQCDLWLRDDSVSQVHASLVLTPRGLWVIDLLGRGSVLVNGRPAYWKQVHDGTRVQIGRYRFRARFESARTPTARRVEDRPVPEMLAAPARQASPGGGLSEPSVMALIQHMADMQNQFFEHSQSQMQFMAQMLAHMGRSQEASVRQDVARIEEITRELEELKAQLAGQQSAAAPRRKKRKSAATRKKNHLPQASRAPAAMPSYPPPEAAATSGSAPAAPQAHPVPAVPERAPALSKSEAHRDSAEFGEDVEDVAESSVGDLGDERESAPPAVSDAHARLTERMARLARERNAGWRRILAAFTGKPRGRADE